MTNKLDLPKLPDSFMFHDFNKIMTTEWQEFFRTLYKITGPGSDDSLISDLSGLYSTSKNFEKRIEELEILVSTLSKPNTIIQDISAFTQPSVEGVKLYEKQITVPAAKSQNAGAGVPPVSAVYGNRIGREYDIGDTDHFELELPYDIYLGRDIEIEVHWFIDEAQDDPGGANEEQVQWRAQYTLTKEDSTETVDFSSTNLNSGDIAIPSDAKILVQTSCGNITSGLFEQHDNLGITIKRLAVTKDDPANDPILLTVEIEYYSKYPGIPK